MHQKLTSRQGGDVSQSVSHSKLQTKKASQELEQGGNEEEEEEEEGANTDSSVPPPHNK